MWIAHLRESLHLHKICGCWRGHTLLSNAAFVNPFMSSSHHQLSNRGCSITQIDDFPSTIDTEPTMWTTAQRKPADTCTKWCTWTRLGRQLTSLFETQHQMMMHFYSFKYLTSRWAHAPRSPNIPCSSKCWHRHTPEIYYRPPGRAWRATGLRV